MGFIAAFHSVVAIADRVLIHPSSPGVGLAGWNCRLHHYHQWQGSSYRSSPRLHLRHSSPCSLHFATSSGRRLWPAVSALRSSPARGHSTQRCLCCRISYCLHPRSPRSPHLRHRHLHCCLRRHFSQFRIWCVYSDYFQQWQQRGSERHFWRQKLSIS